MRIFQTTLLVVMVLIRLDAQEVSWVANGRDVQGTRYLPASEIARDTVGRLEVAWTYRTGETEPAFARSEERRVGKECSVTCRSRWSPYH